MLCFKYLIVFFTSVLKCTYTSVLFCLSALFHICSMCYLFYVIHVLVLLLCFVELKTISHSGDQWRSTVFYSVLPKPELKIIAWLKGNQAES